MDNGTLIIFTVLSQMAAGGFITLYLLDIFSKSIEKELGFFTSRVIAIIMGISLAVSSAHLGNPFAGYLAVSNIAVSWLSREIVFMGAFFAMTVLYAWQWTRGCSRFFTGLLGSVMAILGVFSSGMIYVLPSQPAWNNFGPIFFFFLTAASIGPLFLAVLLNTKNYQLNKKMNLIILFTGVILVFNFLNYLFYLSMLAGGGNELTASYEKITDSVVFWLRIIVGFIIPAVLCGVVYKKCRQNLEFKNYALVLFLLIFAGEILGRTLFYNCGLMVSMFGL